MKRMKKMKLKIMEKVKMMMKTMITWELEKKWREQAK
jgi:hypothetical protein